MGFWDREYNAYVLLGDPKAAAMWHWNNWSAVADALDPLVGLARDKPAVRTTQFEADGKTVVRHGRIGWNRAGHEKWVHSSPKNAAISATWRFLQAEVWAPAWTTCARENLPPDFFFEIRNVDDRQGAPVAFNPAALIAVAFDLGDDARAVARRATESLRASMKARLVVYRKRPWGTPFFGGFKDAMQDLLTVGLFRVGDPQTRPIDETTFLEAWQRLP